MGFVFENAAMAPGESQPAERISPIVRLLPSLTDVTVILTILFLFAWMQGTHSLLGDGDTGWHVRTGQWILAHGQVPHQDIFSYTVPGRPWFAWEWLWDVVFALIYDQAGLGGVVLASLAVLCLTMALLFRLTRRKSGNLLVAFAVTTFAMAGTSIHWLARPHLFTLLFGVIFYSILDRVEEAEHKGDLSRARRLLATLPALALVWTNFHGGFLLGIILTACYGLGEMLAWLFDPAAGREALHRARRYLLTAAVCLAVSVINPYFLSLHAHILDYFRDSFAFDNIGEFQSVSFHSPLAWTLEIMIILGAVAAYREIRRRRFAVVLLFVAWAHLALVAARNIPIFMIVAAPLVAAHLAEIIASLGAAPVPGWISRAARSFDRFAAEVDENDRIGRVHLVSAAALAVVALVIYAPAPPQKFRCEYDPQKYPAKALAYLGGAGISNRIFTDDEWGDYVVYTLYPTKVFVDGRSDMYGKKFCQEYLDVLNLKHGWQRTLSRYGVDTMVLRADSPLAGALKLSQNWRVAYDDGVAIVFRPLASSAAPGEQASVVRPDNGTGRDRKITKSQARGLKITKITT